MDHTIEKAVAIPVAAGDMSSPHTIPSRSFGQVRTMYAVEQSGGKSKLSVPSWLTTRTSLIGTVAETSSSKRLPYSTLIGPSK